jgi:uncharacterized Zn finger protein (UPF0148 family)
MSGAPERCRRCGYTAFNRSGRNLYCAACGLDFLPKPIEVRTNDGRLATYADLVSAARAVVARQETVQSALLEHQIALLADALNLVDLAEDT